MENSVKNVQSDITVKRLSCIVLVVVGSQVLDWTKKKCHLF